MSCTLPLPPTNRKTKVRLHTVRSILGLPGVRAFATHSLRLFVYSLDIHFGEALAIVKAGVGVANGMSPLQDGGVVEALEFLVIWIVFRQNVWNVLVFVQNRGRILGRIEIYNISNIVQRKLLELYFIKKYYNVLGMTFGCFGMFSGCF